MYTNRLILVICFLFYATLLSAQYSTYEMSTLVFVANGESPYASQSDVASAQAELGYRYKNGVRGASVDLTKSHYWYLQSANRGHKIAQEIVGWQYYLGEGTSINKGEALAWLEKAGLQYRHQASLKAGKMYYYGEGTTQNYNKAAKMFKDAAWGNIPEGMYYYALCFANGNGVPVDSTKAVFWAGRAIDEGYNWGYWLLGHMYCYGKAVHKNEKAAQYYYEKGDELNVSSCQNDLGVAYATGSFVEKDMDIAMDYYLKAANNGSTTAMSNLAGNYGAKDGDYYNPTQAIFWYRKLVEGGDDSFKEKLIDLYRDTKNYQAVIPLLNEKATTGDASALNELAYYYAQGKGVNVNFDTALSYIEKAIVLEPQEMAFQDSKGDFLVMKGDIKKAIKVWRYINTEQPQFYQDLVNKYGIETSFYKYMKENGY